MIEEIFFDHILVEPRIPPLLSISPLDSDRNLYQLTVEHTISTDYISLPFKVKLTVPKRDINYDVSDLPESSRESFFKESEVTQVCLYRTVSSTETEVSEGDASACFELCFTMEYGSDIVFGTTTDQPDTVTISVFNDDLTDECESITDLF